METFDKAIDLYPDAHPLFHSDRGFQYTSKMFHQKLIDAGMTQRILKLGRYYGKRFESKESLVEMIGKYIDYYNTKRLQRNLGVITPMEKYMLSLAA